MPHSQAKSHRIDRVRFILQTDDALATKVQQRCSQVFHQRLRARLAQVLNRYGSLQIDRLTLDLGELAWHAFEAELQERVLLTLSQQLAQAAAALMREPSRAWHMLLANASIQPRARSKHQSAATANPSQSLAHFQVDSARIALVDASSETRHSQQAGEVVANKIENALKVVPVDSAQSVAQDHPMIADGAALPLASLADSAESAYPPAKYAAARFESYLDSGELIKPQWLGADDWLLAKLRVDAESWQPTLARCCLQQRSLERLLQLYCPDTLRQISHLLSGSASELAQSENDTPAPYLVLGALRFFQRHPALAMPRADGLLHADTVQPELALWLAPLQSAPPTPILQQWLRPLFEQPRLQRLVQQHLPDTLMTTLQTRLAVEPAAPRSIPASLPRVLPPASTAAPDASYAVSNAGLGLLWPLLPGLLSRLGLLQNNIFIDSAARLDAVGCLDWVIWHDAAHHDECPLLTRYLCGLPLDLPLDPWHSPSTEQQVTLQQWLSALPLQLPGLHHCSADDLRQLFLRRPGHLLQQETKWILQVEPDVTDILLSRLPWPLNMIVLPWLAEPLTMKWPVPAQWL